MFLGTFCCYSTRFETGFGLVLTALGVIALGTGLVLKVIFKLWDAISMMTLNQALRDRAFIFFIWESIGAMFAPSASEKVCSWILAKSNFVYDARLPQLQRFF
jgi:dipeptide/tripeptide permease